jgi:hydroxymethylpyrimidine/phosphomethylpyrimidine kinase
MMVALELLESCPEFAPMVPEVRTNLVYARQGARVPGDVMAVDGRVTVMAEGVRGAGRPRFGASSHMARLIIRLMEVDPSLRAGVDFRADTDHMTSWYRDYAQDKGWAFGVIDRSREPEELHEEETASMPWKVDEAIRAAGGVPPKLFYETGAVGKEPVAVLVGPDPISVVREATEIARLYAEARK